MSPLLFFLLGACNRSAEDTAIDEPKGPRSAYWDASRAGTAFGAVIVAGSTGAWIGAPTESGGEVHQVLAGSRSLILEGSSDLGLGLSLAWDPTLGLGIGAPLANGGAGAVLDSSEQALVSGQAGDSLGSAMLPTADGWLAAGNEVLRSPSNQEALPGRARALVQFQGQIVAGLAWGSAALWTEAGTIPRLVEGDEAGTSLCVGDVDGDGAEELLVGAPGANTVYVVRSLEDGLQTATAWSAGEGRFGQAVACRQGEAWIGSPLSGSSAQGAVYRRLAGEDLELFQQGRAPGSQLGFSLSSSDSEIWIGAPGTAETTGRAWCVY